MERPSKAHAPLTVADLHKLSKALLRLHKTLLDGERLAYERRHGPIASNGQFLQLVVGHPDFAWLRHLSRLMAELDELTTKADAAEAIGDVLATLRALLTSKEGYEAFGRRYHEALQRDSEAVLADATVRDLLAAPAAQKGEEP